MPTEPAPLENITFVVYPVWTYYRRHLFDCVPPKLLQDSIASGQAQRILDAFGHLSRAEAGFLALVMDVISGEDPLEDREAAPAEQDLPLTESVKGEPAEASGPADTDTTGRQGLCGRLWRRMLAALRKS